MSPSLEQTCPHRFAQWGQRRACCCSPSYASCNILTLISCLCKSWDVIRHSTVYSSEKHGTKEACYLLHLHCACVGGLFLLVFILFQTMHEDSLSPSVMYTKGYYEFVCMEGRFEEGVWSLSFLASSRFWIFLGLSLSHAVLIPNRCFNHMGFFFLCPMLELIFALLVEKSSLKNSLTLSYITSSEVPIEPAGNT